MARFIVKTPIKLFPGKPAIAAGKAIDMDEDEAAELLASGAVERFPEAAADPDSLADKSVAQLLEIAGEEDVALPEKAKKADIIAAIEAKRAAPAAPVAA